MVMGKFDAACWFAMVVASFGAQAPSPVLPILEVALASPVDPVPGLSNRIGDIERRGEDAREVGLGLVRKAYSSALKAMQVRVDGIVDRAMFAVQEEAAPASFLGDLEPGDVASVAVRVSDAAAPLPSMDGKLAMVGQSIVLSEMAFFEQVVKDISHVSDFIADRLNVEFVKQLEAAAGRTGVGFLAAPRLPRQLVVRTVSSDVPYATASSLVQDYSKRSGASQKLAVATALDMLLQFVEAANAMIEDKLQSIRHSF